MKHAIYIMTFTDLWGQVANALSEKHKINPALYVGLPLSENHNSVLNKTLFYDVEDARLAVFPQNFGRIKKKPIDVNLLRTFAKNQAISYEMVSRYSLGKKDGSFEQRRKYLWELYRIWEGIFDELKPDVVISGSMPHRVFDDIIYVICKKKNIPFLSLDITSIKHLTYVSSSKFNKSEIFKIAQSKGKNSKRISNETMEYYKFVRDAPKNYQPFNISSNGRFVSKTQATENNGKINSLLKKLPQPFRLLVIFLKQLIMGKLTDSAATVFTFQDLSKTSRPNAIKTNNLSILILTMKAWINVWQAKRWYLRNIEQPALDKPYIFFPANFQPERSTVPDAGLFYDFAVILQMLDKTLPKDCQLYFKEHPRTFLEPVARDNPRDIDFYLRIKEMCPRVKFINWDFDSNILIKNSTAVAMANGTTGWEAIARGKPVLTFGEYWYVHAKGVFQIASLQDLICAIDKIQSSPDVPCQDVVDYLRAVETVCEDGSYYFIDNVEERAVLRHGKQRIFSADELIYRQEFSVKMADYLASYAQ